jgi:hypothetical protein
MKRTFMTISAFLIICIIPFSTLTGQDKKSEQKIKIVITDDSGTKVMIDTLIKDGSLNDSLRLSNGEVILIGHPENPAVMNHGDGNEYTTVTVTTDGKESNKDFKTITIVSSDTSNRTEMTKGSKVIVMSNDEGKKVEKIVYINEGNSIDNDLDKTFDVYVSTDNKDSSIEKTRYVIAKDGMVVSVEGNDEAKVKDLIKEIENKMGVKSEGSGKNETVTVESKKTMKK